MKGFEADRIKMLGTLTASDNSKVFKTLGMHRSSDKRDELAKIMFETAYLLLTKASQLDPSNKEIYSYKEKILTELKRLSGRKEMTESDIIDDALRLFDDIDAIDLVEECERLLEHSNDQSSNYTREN